MDSAAAAKLLQSCPTLYNPRDGSPPGSPVPGILQARTLEWVAISFSNAWKWKVKVKSLSRVRLLGSPWTAAHQAPPSMGFSRQEYWSGVPLPSPHFPLVPSKRLTTSFRNYSIRLGISHFTCIFQQTISFNTEFHQTHQVHINYWLTLWRVKILFHHQSSAGFHCHYFWLF